MNQRDWKDGDNDVLYYYGMEDGRIIGQVHKIMHTKVWVAKIIHNYNEEQYIGMFVSSHYGQQAVKRHWDIQDRTLVEYEMEKQR